MRFRVLYSTFDERTEECRSHETDTETLAKGAAMLVERDETTSNIRLQSETDL